MKNLVKLFALILLLNSEFIAQNQDAKIPEHKIIFQLSSGDTTAHKQLMKQLNTILSVSPSTQIELVCHGAGMDMLISGKTIVEDKINALAKRGVVFYACEFSIKERKIDRTTILKIAGYVSAGIIEIVSKQEQGWTYIKAGN
jgi:uncharacterized protein